MNRNMLFAVALLLSGVFSCSQNNRASVTIAESQEVMDAHTNDQKLISEVLTVDDYAARLGGQDIQLVDVRTPKEFAAGHLDGAVNIDFFAGNFRAQLKEQLSLEEPVYLYCRSGRRSANTAKILQEMGYAEVYDMAGGYNAWKAAGKK